MNKFNIFLFTCAIMGFFTITIILPHDEKTVEIENRNLTAMPELTWDSLSNNSFTRNLEAYISDHVAYRSYFIGLSKKTDKFYGFSLSEDVEFVASGGTTANNPVQAGNFLRMGNRLMEIFYANEGLAIKYADAINKYRVALPKTVNIYNMLIPTQIEFIDEKFKTYSDSQKDAIELVYGNLYENITAVDAYTPLKDKIDEYIYFRSDHHWTALGAYYAYEAFCTAADIDPIPLSDYNEYYIDNFLGYLYNTSPTDIIGRTPDTIYYYVLKDDNFETSRPLIYLPGDDKATYSLFLGGDWPYYDIETSIKNDKTAVIVKDSYANCFIPFLAPHYERIIVIDPRTFEDTLIDEVKKYSNVDLIFLNYVFTTTFSDTISLIENLN